MVAGHTGQPMRDRKEPQKAGAQVPAGVLLDGEAATAEQLEAASTPRLAR